MKGNRIHGRKLYHPIFGNTFIFLQDYEGTCPLFGAGFPCKDNNWIQKSDYFRQQFEKLLIDVIKISDGKINIHILESGELVTEFTIPAERHTEHLSGIPINTDISRMEANLCTRACRQNRMEMMQILHCMLDKDNRLVKTTTNEEGEEPDDPLSKPISLQGGISIGNAFNMELNQGAASPGDYLYRSGSFKWDVESGMWGILRVLKKGILCKCKNLYQSCQCKLCKKQ